MRVSIPSLCSLVTLVTCIYAASLGAEPEDIIVPIPRCTHDLPFSGYPNGFNSFVAGIRNLQGLCVTLDPGPRCTCVKIANKSWQVTCNPTGAFTSLQGWPNVVTRCVWGCSCQSMPDVFMPTRYDGAALRPPAAANGGWTS